MVYLIMVGYVIVAIVAVFIVAWLYSMMDGNPLLTTLFLLAGGAFLAVITIGSSGMVKKE